MRDQMHAGYGDKAGVLKDSSGHVAMSHTLVEHIAGDGFRS